MGRRRRRGAAGEAISVWREWLAGVDPELLRWSRVAAARGLGALACIVLIGLGLWRLERSVLALPRYDGILTLQWEALPNWLQAPANRHILDGLTEACGLSPRDRIHDAGLARRIGQRLPSEAVGWVSQVRRVEVRSDGVVAVQCSFRRPAAWVRRGDVAYLLSEEGVRLPGRYSVESTRGSALMTIDGSTGVVPAVGEAWPGADVRAGLKVVAACEGRAFRGQIASVLVENHGGRRDRLRPSIELITDGGGGRIWWGRAPGEEDGFEISAEQKLALLESLYRQSGRIDMNRPYVNVTTWADRVEIPASGDGPAGRSTRRG